MVRLLNSKLRPTTACTVTFGIGSRRSRLTMIWLRRISDRAAWISGLRCEQVGQSGVEVERRSRRVERPIVERGRAQLRSTDHGDQVLPASPVVVLRVPERHASPASLDLGLEQVGLIGLAYVDELFCGPHGVVVELDQLAMDLDEPLGGEDLEEADADTIQDAEGLRLGLPACGVGFLREFGPAEPELATGDELLLDVSRRRARRAFLCLLVAIPEAVGVTSPSVPICSCTYPTVGLG